MCYADMKLKEVNKLLNSLENDTAMVYDDIFCGSDFIEFSDRVVITNKDTMVSFSIDGAQLYQNKKSDTWIAVWQVINFSPQLRFKQKKTLPCTVIPGLNKPKITESYLFRAIHHLSVRGHPSPTLKSHSSNPNLRDSVLSTQKYVPPFR